MKREFFKARDGKELSLAVWDEVEMPRGVIQISHGMSEHIARYDDFALFMNGEGYIVFGDDHRAHGYTDKDALGLTGDGDLFEDTVRDEIELTDYAKEKWKLPVILLGHSYGSFIAQRYLTYGENGLKGAILSGSAFMTGFAVTGGKLLSKNKIKPAVKDKPGKLFAKLSFGGYDKKVKDGYNGWLNRDKEEVNKYNADVLCGFTCSNGFYHYFFKGLDSIRNSKYAALDKSFRILIASGSEDRVGGCGKLVRKLYNRFVSLGFKPELKLSDGARHEILNELNKTEVYRDFADFANSLI